MIFSEMTAPLQEEGSVSPRPFTTNSSPFKGHLCFTGLPAADAAQTGKGNQRTPIKSFHLDKFP
ncbi:MAG: hypothetical protein CO150_07005, partial [Nitrospirae bacterium CG_4_9_14_3_um_filter_53_35]